MADTLERFAAARLWLSVRVPFLGALLHALRPRLARARDGVPTAAVTQDGTLYLNAAFCETLSEPELRFLVAHEVLHPALRFWARRGARDPLLFNMAHDHAINLLLAALRARTPGLAPPPGALMDARYVGWSAEEIYDDLLRWREYYGQAPAPPGYTPDCRSDRVADAERADDWANRVRQALELHRPDAWFGGEGQGEMPGELMLAVDAGPREAVIDWRDELRAWVGERALTVDFSYRRPSRRDESAGAVLASVVRTGVPHITILWDTSGSMMDAASTVFTELRAIVDALGLSVRLIACDSEIQADVASIDAAEDAVGHARGGGGSDFRPAFERLEREDARTLVLAFTDGCIDVPAWPPACLVDTVWVIVPPGEVPAHWGGRIFLSTGGGER